MAAMRDAIISAPALIKQLLSLLAGPPPLPPVLAGYVCKVLKSLQRQNPDSFAQADGMPEPRALVPQMMKHIGSDAVLQLLIALCIGEPPVTEPGGPASSTTPRDDLAAQSWLPHELLIPAAFDALTNEDPEVVANSSQLLCALLAASSEPPQCLEVGAAGRERCAQLVRVCLSSDETPNLPAIDVVLQLLTRLREGQSTSPVSDALLDQIEIEIDRFFAAVAAPSPLPARFARFFADDPPAYRPRGAQRCKLLLLMEESLKSVCARTHAYARAHGCPLNLPFSVFCHVTPMPYIPFQVRPGLIMPLVELGLFPIVLDLLLLPHSCNALHMRAAAILEWAISFTSSSEDLVASVRKALITDAQVAKRLIVLAADSAPLSPGPELSPPQGTTSLPVAGAGAVGCSEIAAEDKLRSGRALPCCHAFAMHIGACLLSASQRESEVRNLLDIQGANCWAQFIAPGGPLTVWEQLQSRPLGGNAPTRGSEDSDEDDELDSTAMERVLAAQAAAAASRGMSDAANAGANDSHENNDDDDDEGDHSSSYIQHFAQYLSNRNFLNQTSDNPHDLVGMADQLPPPTSEAWTAEFDLDDFGVDARGAPAMAGGDVGNGAATGGSQFSSFVNLDDEEMAAATTLANGESDGALPMSGDSAAAPPSSMASWAADFSSSSADLSDPDVWAAFDAPSTGPASNDELAIGSPDAAAGGERDLPSGRSSQGDSELAI